MDALAFHIGTFDISHDYAVQMKDFFALLDECDTIWTPKHFCLKHTVLFGTKCAEELISQS